MKKIVVFVVTLFLFTSCVDMEAPDEFGFTFNVANKSGMEHNNVKITIGGIQNGEFIGTSSYIFPTILVLSNDWPDTTGNQSQRFAQGEERWNPDLSQVKAISERAYFMIQFEGKPPVLLYDYFRNDNGVFVNSGNLVSATIPDNNIVINNFGFMSIGIDTDDVVYGELLEN